MLEVLGLTKAKSKAPAELVRAAREAVLRLEGASQPSPSQPSASTSVLEEITRHFGMMKQILYGEPDNPPDKQIALDLAREATPPP